jgi:hypothetical protein
MRPADPLRALAEERGRMMGELGVRPDDVKWARLEANAIASLTTPTLVHFLGARLSRVLGRLRRALR